MRLRELTNYMLRETDPDSVRDYLLTALNALRGMGWRWLRDNRNSELGDEETLPDGRRLVVQAHIMVRGEPNPTTINVACALHLHQGGASHILDVVSHVVAPAPQPPPRLPGEWDGWRHMLANSLYHQADTATDTDVRGRSRFVTVHGDVRFDDTTDTTGTVTMAGRRPRRGFTVASDPGAATSWMDDGFTFP